MSEDRDWTPERCSGNGCPGRCSHHRDHRGDCYQSESHALTWDLLAEARKEAEGLRERLAEAGRKLDQDIPLEWSKMMAEVDSILKKRSDETTMEAAKRVYALLIGSEQGYERVFAEMEKHHTNAEACTVAIARLEKSEDAWSTVALALALAMAGRKA